MEEITNQSEQQTLIDDNEEEKILGIHRKTTKGMKINCKPGRNPDLYHKQKLCKGKKRDGTLCKGVALVGSDFCRCHSRLPSLKKLSNQFEAYPERYKINNTVLKYHYQSNLASKNITNLRDEIALLQSYLAGLINSTSTSKDGNGNQEAIPNIELQLKIISELKTLTMALKKIELQDKFFNKANEAIRNTVTQIVLIIDRFVTDKQLKALIANEIFKLGASEEEPQDAIDVAPELENSIVRGDNLLEKLEKVVESEKEYIQKAKDEVLDKTEIDDMICETEETRKQDLIKSMSQINN